MLSWIQHDGDTRFFVLGVIAVAKLFKVGAAGLLAGPLGTCLVTRCCDSTCRRFTCQAHLPGRESPFPIDIRCYCATGRDRAREDEMVGVLQLVLRCALDEALRTYNDTVTSEQKEAATTRASAHRNGLRKLLYEVRADRRVYKMVGGEPRRLTKAALWVLFDRLIDDGLPISCFGGPRT